MNYESAYDYVDADNLASPERDFSIDRSGNNYLIWAFIIFLIAYALFGW